MRILNLNSLRKIGTAFALITCILYATSAYSASKTVLVLGDSLSAEYGLARGTGWVPLLERRLKEQKIDAVIVNASVSGETTSGGMTRLPTLLAKYSPHIVIVELGANDGLRGLSLVSAAANLDGMIKAAKKTQAKVLLLGVRLPPNYGANYTEKFSTLFAKIAKENKVSLVPFFLEGFADRPELFQSDRLHPTAAAQAIILDNVWPALQPLLK
ncbi:MAG: arylesterase [Burkholderiales bacterium]|nr:arylesterase [Burkholderiales bacterium]